MENIEIAKYQQIQSKNLKHDGIAINTTANCKTQHVQGNEIGKEDLNKRNLINNIVVNLSSGLFQIQRKTYLVEV